MRTDYFDHLLPASVTHVTQAKTDCVTPENGCVTNENNELGEASRTSRTSRAETGNTDKETRKTNRVYHYRLADNPAAWLVMIAPGSNLDEARESLLARFGSRLIDVVPAKR